MTNKQIVLYPYHQASESARLLSQALGIKRLKHKNSTFIGTKDDYIINWGCSSYKPSFGEARIINHPQFIQEASNKLKFFRLMDVPNGPRIPPYTDDSTIALGWLSPEDGRQVCIRTTLSGHSGSGLSILSHNMVEQFVEAPLYTLYIPKKYEYRLHFAFGKLIDIQRKALRKGIDPKTVNWQIRNLKNNFIYVRKNLNTPPDVILQATKAYNLSNLNFGAVDVIWNEYEQKAYVLEINTAPGLRNSTLEPYIKAFKEELFTPDALPNM